MAWNVVIAGGGFAGASAARELEKLLPKQSARLILVNDVNFMLYTPFLPEAAAGMLEPRHVVTPLRDMLKRTNLRLGAVSGHDPEGAHRRDLDPRGRGRDDPLRPVPGRGGLGLPLASGARARPARDRLQEPRRRDLAPQPRDRDARARERVRGRRAPRGASDLRLRRRRLLGPRGARRASGLRRRRDRPLPARPPDRHALDPGRGDGPRPARGRPGPRRLRRARASRPRHRRPPWHPPRGGARGLVPPFDRRGDPDPDDRLDRRRRAASRA